MHNTPIARTLAAVLIATVAIVALLVRPAYACGGAPGYEDSECGWTTEVCTRGPNCTDGKQSTFRCTRRLVQKTKRTRAAVPGEKVSKPRTDADVLRDVLRELHRQGGCRF